MAVRALTVNTSFGMSTYVFGENSLKFSEDSGVVDQYIYSVTIAIGLTHSTTMKVKQFH